jgi:hypothetical protein
VCPCVSTIAAGARVYQSGERDPRGPLATQGRRYTRWAPVEAATHACTHPAYRERYQQLKARTGKQRSATLAQIDLARRLTEAIWHMLTRNQPFAPKGTTDPRPPDGPQRSCATGANPNRPCPPNQEAIQRPATLATHPRSTRPDWATQPRSPNGPSS